MIEWIVPGRTVRDCDHYATVGVDMDQAGKPGKLNLRLSQRAATDMGVVHGSRVMVGLDASSRRLLVKLVDVGGYKVTRAGSSRWLYVKAATGLQVCEPMPLQPAKFAQAFGAFWFDAPGLFK